MASKKTKQATKKKNDQATIQRPSQSLLGKLLWKSAPNMEYGKSENKIASVIAIEDDEPKAGDSDIVDAILSKAEAPFGSFDNTGPIENQAITSGSPDEPTSSYPAGQGTVETTEVTDVIEFKVPNSDPPASAQPAVVEDDIEGVKDEGGLAPSTTPKSSLEDISNAVPVSLEVEEALGSLEISEAVECQISTSGALNNAESAIAAKSDRASALVGESHTTEAISVPPETTQSLGTSEIAGAADGQTPTLGTPASAEPAKASEGDEAEDSGPHASARDIVEEGSAETLEIATTVEGQTSASEPQAEANRCTPGAGELTANKKSTKAGRAAAQICEDRRHPSTMPHVSVQKDRADHVARCQHCRKSRKQAAMSVGSRGLRIGAYFQMRPSSEITELADRGNFPFHVPLPELPVCAREGHPETPTTPQKLDNEATEEDRHLLDVTPHEKHRRRNRRVASTSSWSGAEEPNGNVTASRRVEPKRKRRRRVVTSSGDEDACGQSSDEDNTSHPIDGLLDIYKDSAILRNHQPSTVDSAAGLTVFACAMWRAPETVRLNAEEVIFTAFGGLSRECISHLMGLRPEGLGPLRSGKRPSRLGKHRLDDRWLLWEKVGDRVVAAAILVRQQYTNRGPRHLRGGIVLEYIVAHAHEGGKGHLLVLAAQEVCRLQGFSELFSACDMSQDGRCFGGRATPAWVAHNRWGFKDIDPEEWSDRKFKPYTRASNVKFMVKIIPPKD